MSAYMSDRKFFPCRLLGRAPELSARAHAAGALVCGPVGDPQGPWGLGIVRAPDLEAVQAFTAKDPVIVAKLGFRAQVMPRLQAVLPSDL